jgi:hypothetical protein
MALETLRRASKHYGAAPNITMRLETLRSRSKHYDDAPNIAARLQTLRSRSKLYGVARNITEPLQTLRRASKHYGAAPNIMVALQTTGLKTLWATTTRIASPLPQLSLSQIDTSVGPPKILPPGYLKTLPPTACFSFSAQGIDEVKAPAYDHAHQENEEDKGT